MSSEEILSSDDEFYKEAEGVRIRVSGLQGEDVFTRDGVYKGIVASIKKLRKMLAISDLTLNVKKYHETGDRHKYSIKIRIMSDRGTFHADDHEWSIFKAVEKALEKLESEVFRKEDRGKVHTKAH
jgi:ribosome-associated translation inhibitor RaiA